jgi:hypothetical protein
MILQAKTGTWKAYNSGSGQTAPVFPKTVTYVAGIPLDGQGNLNVKGGGKSNQVVRTGGATPAGSNRKLGFL